MPNDARLGLVIGVTLVILMAVLFVRKESTTPANASPTNATSVSATVQSRLSAPIPGVAGVPSSGGSGLVSTLSSSGPRTHRVGEGETLMSLAVRYYGSHDHFSVLWEANRDQLRSPDRVTVGMVLRVPPLPGK